MTTPESSAYRVENPSKLFRTYEEERSVLVTGVESLRPVLKNETGQVLHGPPTLVESAGYIQAKNELLAFDQTRDSLTGALSREGFKTALNRRFTLLGRQVSDSSQIDLLMIMDTDRFKAINDTHGHSAGDFVLQALATTLALEGALRTKQAKRKPDIVARLGGDEFAALLHNIPEENHEATITRIKQRLGSIEIPYKINGEEITFEVGMSIGVFAVRHGTHIEPSEALHKADLAMYKEKERRHPQSTVERLMAKLGWVRQRGR